MTTYNEVAAFVLTEATNDELNSLAEAIKMRRTQLTRKTVWTLRAGDTVTFVARGRKVQGVVAKIMQKNVQVKEGYTMWKVPASMLSKADAA